MKVIPKIRIQEGWSWEKIRLALEYARFLGFETECAVFPIASTEEGEAVPTEWAELASYGKASQEKGTTCKSRAAEEFSAEYEPASHHIGEFYDPDEGRITGLETLFSRGNLLPDKNCDFLPDAMNFQFILPEKPSAALVAAACNLAFRFGMETTGYQGMLLAEENAAAKGVEGNRIIFEEASRCGISYEESADGLRVCVRGSGTSLASFVAELCNDFPKQGAFDTWRDRLMELEKTFSGATLDGQLAALEAMGARGATLMADPEIEQRRVSLEQAFPQTVFINYKQPEEVETWAYDFPWEVDVLREELERSVYPKVKAGGSVRIEAAVSEPPEVREALADEVKSALLQRGASAAQVQIVCAYKQGYSWIDEQVLPMLSEIGAIASVEIGFRPFLPPGETTWRDEDGAVPSYHNVDENPDRWYDLPIRYLQELYPIVDVIVSKLFIPRKAVTFVNLANEGKPDTTYRLRAFSESGSILWEGFYTAEAAERPYLDAYPKLGKVHPPTGYVRFFEKDVLCYEKRIPTDLEKLWDVYQKEVLPKCRAYVEAQTEGAPTADRQPFFSQLKMEIELSEPDYPLQSRQDIFSSLDGFHEDLYFVGLDYFKNYGLEKAGEVLDSPGLLLPILHNRSGAPHMKVTLYRQKAPAPSYISSDGTTCTLQRKNPVYVWLRAMEAEADGRRAVLRIRGAEEAVCAGWAQAYADLTQRGLLSLPKRITGVQTLVFEFESDAGTIQTVSLPACAAEVPPKDRDIRTMDLAEESVLGYEQTTALLHKLERVPGLAVYPIAVSYTGRTVYAVEIEPHGEGYISRTKRMARYPSVYINARHHANEVSSSNAAFRLIRRILTEKDLQEAVQAMNLVIVPMENVDGAALHYELQKEHPHWKYHVSRFNALGKEFFYETDNPETIHTEALGFKRLYETFSPDILIDNHGVPTHEWDQPFSGYTSPSYKGFWLPRSLLYGYFWYVTDDCYRSNHALNEVFQDVIADAMAEDFEIRAWNREWAEQFETYAHAWMPKLFPADYYKEMIHYWVPSPYNPAYRYRSIRYPWITSVCYTSEVADETAQGSYLSLCARAHVQHDVALLRSIAGAKSYMEQWCTISQEHIDVRAQRLRPIVVQK